MKDFGGIGTYSESLTEKMDGVEGAESKHESLIDKDFKKGVAAEDIFSGGEGFERERGGFYMEWTK